MKYFLILSLFLGTLVYSFYWLYMYDKRDKNKISSQQEQQHKTLPDDYLSKKFFKNVTMEGLKERLKSIENINKVHPVVKRNMLHFLVKHGKDLKMIELLIKSGINYTARDANNMTALHMAVTREKEDYLWTKELLRWPYTIDVRGKRGASPLMLAIYNRSSIEIIKLLLERGADPNFKLEDNSTPLIVASVPNKRTKNSFIDPQVIQLLLDHKADITIKNSKGKTALDYMKENKEFSKTEIFKNLYPAFKP